MLDTQFVGTGIIDHCEECGVPARSSQGKRPDQRGAERGEPHAVTEWALHMTGDSSKQAKQAAITTAATSEAVAEVLAALSTSHNLP